MQFAQIMQLSEAGVPFSAEAKIKAATIQNKNDLLEDSRKQQEQMMQLEQQKAQSDLMVAQANARLLESQAKANDAMALERESRVAENQVFAYERHAKAQDSLAMAKLHQAELLQKLQEIPINNLEKLINIAQNLKQETPTPEVANG